MEYTLEQRVEIVKIYYKKGKTIRKNYENFAETVRKVRTAFVLSYYIIFFEDM